MRTIAWKLFGFSGRISRRDYWVLGLPAFIALIAVNLLTPAGATSGDGALFRAFLRLVLSAAPIWALYAVALKRCHDRGRGRGWLLLFMLTPVVGWLWGLVELGFLRGQAGENRFGASPRGEESLDEVFA